MKELKNNAYFWQKLDTIYLSSDFVVSQAKGSVHPDHPYLKYPCTYGFLKAFTTSEMDMSLPCFKGSDPAKELDRIVVSADILNKDIKVTLLIGCTETEQDEILHFLNQTDYQKSILIKRGNEVPSWAETED